MRRPAAALASALLAATVLAGPSMASAAPPGPGCDVAATPTCAVIDEVRALLGSVQPVAELAGPALGDLGASVGHLGALLSSSSDASPSDVLAAAESVLDQLGALSAPVLDVLASGGVDVDAVKSALTQLQDLAEAQLAPAGAPAPAPATSEGSSASGAPATSASGSGPTGFGGDLSATATSSPDATTSPAVPDVPVGGTLELGPLALPSYSFTGTPAASADELATAAAVAELVRPAVAAAATPEPDSSRATAVVMAVCVLMLAAGLLLDQRQKARLPIRV